MMDRQAVKSRDIALVGYEKESRTLEVAFRSGGVYHYCGVSEQTHREMLQAPSIGSFFADKIRNAYPFEKRH